MDDCVMVPHDDLEKLAKLTAFNTSALAANVSSWAKNLLAAAPQQAAEASEIQHPCDVPGLCAKMNRKCDQCDPQQQADAGHSCSYYCTRPECVRAQRDELRDRLEAQQQAEPLKGMARFSYALKAESGYECEGCYPAITPEQYEQVIRVLEGAQQTEPVAMTDEHIETFVSQYNDVYCDQRRAGVGGGDAERAAMRQVLILALGAHKPRTTAEQVEQIKRLADEYARSYIENWSALMDLAPHMYDSRCEDRDNARAALHATLDALVKGE